jgi:hypothetical protein
MLKLIDGCYHISTPEFYKRPGWYMDRVCLNQAHVILYRNGKQVGRLVPPDTVVEPCMADPELELPTALNVST